MSEYFSWHLFLTVSGAATVTALITQFLKELVREKLKIPPQILSYIVAVIIMSGAAFFTGTAETPGDWLIIPINALIVAGSSNAAYIAVRDIHNKLLDELAEDVEEHLRE